MSPNEKRRLAKEQSKQWLQTLQSPQLSDVDRDAFVDWLRESSLHVSEMLRVIYIEESPREVCRQPEGCAPEISDEDDVIPLMGFAPTAAMLAEGGIR